MRAGITGGSAHAIYDLEKRKTWQEELWIIIAGGKTPQQCRSASPYPSASGALPQRCGRML